MGGKKKLQALLSRNELPYFSADKYQRSDMEKTLPIQCGDQFSVAAVKV